MRNDAFHLREILDAAEQLESLRAATDSEERLLQDRAFRHSVLFEFIAIGEHAGAHSPELKDRRREVPWPRIVAFRHRVAHGYFELSLAIVLRIWTQQIPVLKREIAAILEEEFPEAGVMLK